MEIRPWPSRAASQDLSKAEPFVLGPLAVDPPTRRVASGRRDGVLEPRVMRVLVALAGANGKVLSRDDLIAMCWDGQIVGDNAINRVISRLRAVLADLAGDVVVLETITKVGFRLLGAAPCLTTSPQTKRRSSGLAVAVLAFDHLSDDPANGYLADGLAEELITILSRIAELRVSARTSSFAYRGRQVSVRDIGRELEVDRLIEGSVRVSGARLRVTIQLVDALSGFHIWAGNFDRELTDLLAVQDDIAKAIAEALESELGAIDPPSRDLGALHLYMQANAIRERGRADDLVAAVALYRQALARDPGFTQASINLALILLLSSNNGSMPVTVRVEARERGEQALRRDPRHASARMVFGGLDGQAGRWLEAEDNFLASLASQPRESVCESMYGYYVLAPCGHLGRAQAAIARAFELAPAIPLHSLGCATMAGMRGDGQLVLANLRKAVTLGLSADEPAIRVIRAAIALNFGEWEDAVEHMTVAFPIELRATGKETANLVYRACRGLVDPSAASAAVARLTAAADTDDLFTRYQIVIGTMIEWQVLLGKLDAAFEVCDRILAAWERTGQLATMGLFHLWIPSMLPFRQDARFSGFVERLGMFAYWDRHGPPDGHAIQDGKLVCL